jgi:hypothetical protein
MFPDVRLMIAAVAASVVALSCGFGVFAALRVNHEPLARLPPATAPLQLVANNTAAPVPPPARPSPVGEPEIATAAPEAPAGESAHPESDQTPSASSAAEPEAVASMAKEKTETAAQPVDPPVTNSITLAADDHPSGAAEPEPVPVAAGGGATSVASGGAAAAAADDGANAEKPAAVAAEPVPATMPDVAPLSGPRRLGPRRRSKPIRSSEPRRPSRPHRPHRPSRLHGSSKPPSPSKHPGPSRTPRVSNPLPASRPVPLSKPLLPTRSRGRIRKTTRPMPPPLVQGKSRARSTRRRASPPKRITSITRESQRAATSLIRCSSSLAS